MTHWTASVIAILLAGFAGVASAQVNCEAIPHGPARTDCYLGLSEFYRGQSDLAAARARAQSDAAWYRAITGTEPPKHKPHWRRYLRGTGGKGTAQLSVLIRSGT
jgi:hypothetical protein